MPTSEELKDTAAEIAAVGVQSVTTEGQTTVTMDPEKLLRVADKLKTNDVASGTNSNGGPRSGWGMIRQARAIPPGAA